LIQTNSENILKAIDSRHGKGNTLGGWNNVEKNRDPQPNIADFQKNVSVVYAISLLLMHAPAVQANR